MKKIIPIVIALLMGYGCAAGPAVKEIQREPVFYPPIPTEPRLQFLQTIRSERDIGTKLKTTFDDFLTGRKNTFKSFQRIWDIHSSKGKIYLLDRDVRKLVIVDLVNRKFEFLQDTRLGKLIDPAGIWVTEDEVKYITDSNRKQVVVFGKDNNFIRTYGDKNLFQKPLDVAVYENSVYVVDMATHQVHVLDRDTGRHTGTIGEGGVEEGKLYKPTHVIVDRSGNVFVNDAFNFRVQKFDSKGKFIKSYGGLGDNLGSFARPKGIDVDRDGVLYVADAAFQRVQLFNTDNSKLLLYFGGVGGGPGSMNLPAGLHIDYDNVEFFKELADRDFELKYLVYVSNLLDRNINVYGFGEWVGPPLSGEQSTGNESASENKQTQ